jgi:2-haloacid dehalogenase
MMANHSIAVFDLGGVLIDWNPRYMYCKLFDGDDSAMEHFLATVCTPSWNEQQDAGRTFADACASLKSDTPRGAGGLVSGAASKAVVPLVEASR